MTKYGKLFHLAPLNILYPEYFYAHFRGGKQGTERSINLQEVTQLINAVSGFKSRSFWFPKPEVDLPAPAHSPVPNGRDFCWRRGDLGLNRNLGDLVLELHPQRNNMRRFGQGQLTTKMWCRQNKSWHAFLLLPCFSLGQWLSQVFSRHGKSVVHVSPLSSAHAWWTVTYTFLLPLGPAQPQNPSS